MKNLWHYNSVVIISLLTTFSVQAAEITVNFADGQVLDAATMTGIKGAVNDNDARTTTNEVAIGAAAVGISTNTGNISSNSAGITSNTTAISSNAGNITSNTGNITANSTDIGTNTTDITINTSDITTNTADITTNTDDISVNVTDISINTSDISINTTDISINTTDIASLFSGDGSAGDLVVSTAVNWSSTPPTNPYFANITIESGQTLTVPAGTTILCSGTFINNGTLTVLQGAIGNGTNFSAFTPSSSGPQAAAHPGDSYGSATLGEFHNNGISDPTTVNGGEGGTGIPQATAKLSFGQFRFGGGAGAGAVDGGKGGGLVRIYCNGSIINNSNITADGQTGSGSVGGGGGGIVILASNKLIDNTLGTISVKGGNGGNDGLFGASGGGGGGIIITMSPTEPVPGNSLVAGGTAGTSLNTQTSKGRLAGSGGGASGGSGGNGGSTSSTGANNTAGNGSTGYVISTTGNPVYLAR